MFLTRKTKINLQNRTFKRKKINLNQTIKKYKKINFTLKNKVGGSSTEPKKNELIDQIIFILEVYYLKNINEECTVEYFENLEKNLKKVDGKNNEMFNIQEFIIESDIIKQKILDKLGDLSKDQEASEFFKKFQGICKMESIDNEDKMELIKNQKLDEVTEIALKDMINYGFLNNSSKNIIINKGNIIKLNPNDEGYSVLINEKNFNMNLCLRGINLDSQLFTLGFFYDKILPESLKETVYLHRKIIFSPYYERSLRNDFYIENEFLFFENFDNFLLQCKNSACKICIALVTLLSDNARAGHSTIVVLDKTKDPHTIEYYDSNSNKAYYGKKKNNNIKNHSIGENVSFFYDKLNRNKTTLEEIYGNTLNIVGSEYIRQIVDGVCGVWSNFTGIFRMFGITKDEIEDGLGKEQTKKSVMNSQENKLFSYSKLFMDLIVKILDLKESSDSIKSNIIKDKLINDEKMFDFLKEEEKKPDRIKYEKEILFPPQFKMKEVNIEISNVNIRELLYRFPYFLINKKTDGEFELTYLEENHTQSKTKFDEFIKEKFELGEPQKDTSTLLTTRSLKQKGISVEETKPATKPETKPATKPETKPETEKITKSEQNQGKSSVIDLPKEFSELKEVKNYRIPPNNYEAGHNESNIGVKKNETEGNEIEYYEKKMLSMKDYGVGDYINFKDIGIFLKCVSLNQSSVLFIRINKLPSQGNIIEINMPKEKVTLEQEPVVEKIEPSPVVIEKETPINSYSIEDFNKFIFNKNDESDIFKMGEVTSIVGEGIYEKILDLEEVFTNESDNTIISYIYRFYCNINNILKQDKSIRNVYDKFFIKTQDDAQIKNLIISRIQNLQKIYSGFSAVKWSKTNLEKVFLKNNQELLTSYEEFKENLENGWKILNSDRKEISFKINDEKQKEEIDKLVDRKSFGEKCTIEDKDNILLEFIVLVCEILKQYGEMLNYIISTLSSKGGGLTNFSFKIREGEEEKNNTNNTNNTEKYTANHENSTITVNQNTETSETSNSIFFNDYKKIDNYIIGSCFSFGNIILKCISLNIENGKPRAKFIRLNKCDNVIKLD